MTQALVSAAKALNNTPEAARWWINSHLQLFEWWSELKIGHVAMVAAVIHSAHFAPVSKHILDEWCLNGRQDFVGYHLFLETKLHAFSQPLNLLRAQWNFLLLLSWGSFSFLYWRAQAGLTKGFNETDVQNYKNVITWEWVGSTEPFISNKEERPTRLSSRCFSLRVA